MTDEHALVRRIQQGDQAAFRDLVERYNKMVYYLAVDLCGDHHDAEDISQEVFIKVYRSIGTFKSGAKLSTWLHRITVNTFIDVRRKKRHVVVPLTMDGGEEGGVIPIESLSDGRSANPEQLVSAAKVDRHVKKALEFLSEQERTVFIMRHYHDLKLKEISTSLGVAEGTVKSLLFRSVRKLRERLSFYRDELGMEDSR